MSYGDWSIFLSSLRCKYVYILGISTISVRIVLLIVQPHMGDVEMLLHVSLGLATSWHFLGQWSELWSRWPWQTLLVPHLCCYTCSYHSLSYLFAQVLCMAISLPVRFVSLCERCLRKLELENRKGFSI